MFYMITALLVGLVTGAIQYYLLFKFVNNITGNGVGKKTVLFALTQFLFPFAVLIICAFLLPDNLLWVGIGIAAALIVFAVVRFVRISKEKK